MPNMNVVRRGVVIRFTTNLDHGLGRFSMGRNFNENSRLPIIIIGIVGTPQMVFTSPIMIIHVNKTTYQPLMSSMIVGRYKNTYVENRKRGYLEPFVITQGIIDHKNGHFVKLNGVALKYPDFKKDIDLDVNVRMFNFVVKANAKTSKEYIINVFSYMLKDMTSDWCHNYMLEFPNCIFSELTQAFCKCHQKIQNDEQIYMELKNMK